MRLRRGPLQVEKRAVRYGLVPLQDLPARLRRAGHGVLERRGGRFRFIQGEEAVKTFASSSFGRRQLCGRCGTPLVIRVDFQPETVDFPVATLDSPDAVAPGFHLFWTSRIDWFDPGDDLPRHERFRPDTRGLKGTEPPGGGADA